MTKKRTKKTRQARHNSRIILQKKIVLCVFLCTLVIILGYIILLSNVLEPKINQLTASYISFNNRNSTDMLRINNLEKMSNKKGNSILNNNTISFEILSDKKNSYEIVLFPLNNIIEEKYIYYSLTIDNKTIIKTLDQSKEKEIGERIIYQGTNKRNKKAILRMWVSEDCKQKIKDISFEIKVK